MPGLSQAVILSAAILLAISVMSTIPSVVQKNTITSKEVNDFCLELSKIRTKPVVPLILKKQDLIKELKNRKEAILSLIKESIILKGESVFVEVIKNAKK